MDKPTDFNDLAAVKGLDAVKASVDKAVNSEEMPVFDWPAPMLPGSVDTPDIPAELLPGWLGAMCRAVAESTQTPTALAVMVGLSVLATVLQRRYEVAPSSNHVEPLALWTLTAMPSGSRKSSVFSAMTRPLMSWEKREYDRGRFERGRAASARKVAERRIDRLQSEAARAKDDDERERLRVEIQKEGEDMPAELLAPRLFTDDVTPERLQAMLAEYGERMALLSDEGGIFQIMAGIYSGGVANLDAFLKGHAGTSIRVDRAGRKAHVDKPALTFGLALQPDILAEAAASRRFRSSGLLARFLYALPVSNVGRRDMSQHKAVPDDIREAYESALYGLLEDMPAVPGKPRVLPMTEPAREEWAAFAQEVEDNHGAGRRYESITDWTSKLPGAVARIAALCELAETGRNAQEVSHSATCQAIALGRLLIPHTQAAFGLVGADEADTDATAIVAWIRANGLREFSRRDCQGSLNGRFRNSARMNKALGRLEQWQGVRNYIRKNRGAPNTMMYAVNPGLLLF